MKNCQKSCVCETILIVQKQMNVITNVIPSMHNIFTPQVGFKSKPEFMIHSLGGDPDSTLESCFI